MIFYVFYLVTTTLLTYFLFIIVSYNFYLSKSSARTSNLNVAIEKGTIIGTQSGYREDTVSIQGGYSQDTVRIQGGYSQDTVRIQGGYSQDTGRKQSGYGGVLVVVVVVFVSVTTGYCSIVYLHYRACLDMCI